MKVFCSKEYLLEGINIVQKAVSTKTTQPILEGILLEANNKLKLTGNDTELGIECFVEANVERPGSIVINSKMLGDIIRRMPDSEVLIDIKENDTVIIECENAHFEVKGISAEGFPALPSIQKENTFKINQKTIKDMIKQTIFSVSMDENRPLLTGSLIECKNNELAVVSIDGFRLALRKIEVENIDSEFNVIVPGKTLNEIVKILQSVDDELYIYSSNNQILFDMGDCKIVSRLLEGEYLNYKNIIPQDYETKITINTKDILSGVERASLINTDEKKYPIKVNITNESIVISSSTNVGNVREEIKANISGDEIEIGFNPRFIIDALKVIDEETIDIYFTSSVGPCTIRSSENNDFSYMILPVRLKN